jgi:ABC-type sugar transport system substrate-binding protein
MRSLRSAAHDGAEDLVAARVFVSLIDEGQEYHRLQAADARAAAARSGLSVDVAFAENNAVLQIHQCFARIHAAEEQRPTAIVVQTIPGEGLERVARNAVGSGIGWLILNRRVPYIEGLRQQKPELPIGCVTPDQEEIGRIHARQVRALVPGGGLLLYIQGPPDTSAAKDRLRTIQQGLAGQPFQWKIVAGDWTEASAESAVNGWLRLKSAEAPALVVAQNDQMAVGARRALLAHHRSLAKVPVIGCDGLPDRGQHLVQAGELAATVVLPPTAGAAVELVGRWQRDRSELPAEIVLTPRGYPDDGSLRPR